MLQTQDNMKRFYIFFFALLAAGALNAQSLQLTDTFLEYTEGLDDDPGFDYDEVTLTNISDVAVTVSARLEMRCYPNDGSGVQFCIPGQCLGPYTENVQIPGALNFTLEPGESTSELTAHLWDYAGTGSAWRVYYFDAFNNADETYIDVVYGECDEQFVIVGVDEAVASTLTVYPNPANEVLTVANELPAGTLFEIYDMTGRVVSNGQINSTNEQIQIADLTPGYYILDVASAKVRFTVK